MPKHIAICQGGWQYRDSVPKYVWTNPSQWEFYSTRPQYPGHHIKCQNPPEGPLMDNHSTKRVRIKKGSLFDTLPAEIFSIIDG